MMTPATQTSEISGLNAENGIDDLPQDQDQLRAALLKQLEYYFSRENLEKDEYLKSQMNAEFFVPISIIANFKMVRALTTDLELISEVLKTSKEVVVHDNGELVRPNIKSQRTTLILRDIQAETPEEVETIFRAEGCAPVKSIKPEIGNTWFVTFETEEEALQTYEVVRLLTFKDQVIHVRVKHENPLKNLLVTQPPFEQYYNPGPYQSAPWQGGFVDYGFGNQGILPPGAKPPRSSNGRGRGGRSSGSRSDGRGDHREYRGEYQGNYSGRSHPRSDRSDPRGDSGKSEYKAEGENYPEVTRNDQIDQKAFEKGSRSDDEEKTKQKGPNSSTAPRVAPNQRVEVPKNKPRNPVPLGPDSFPPLPGAPTTKPLENSSPLNYSVVAQSIEKNVQFVNPRKIVQQTEIAPNSRNSSSEEHLGDETSAHEAKSRSHKNQKPSSNQPTREKEREKVAEGEEKAVPQDQAPVESFEVQRSASNESKEEDSPKSSGSLSYAEILRTRAAQQAPKSSSGEEEDAQGQSQSEERKGSGEGVQRGKNQKPANSTKPKNQTAFTYHDQRQPRHEKGGKGRNHQGSNQRGEREKDDRRSNHREKDGERSPEAEVALNADSSPPPATPAPEAANSQSKVESD